MERSVRVGGAIRGPLKGHLPDERQPSMVLKHAHGSPEDTGQIYALHTVKVLGYLELLGHLLQFFVVAFSQQTKAFQ
ncbi:hypothetical protein FQZ97_1229910 [compost metagenome]